MFGSRAYIQKIIDDVRASYWFIPGTLVILSIGLVEVTSFIDRNPDMITLKLPGSMENTQVEGARSTLAVIAQSIIGVTGVMFSITMVAVSFASGQFGPRLIGNFMRDRGNQWSLGILIATFVYALLTLRAVQNEGSDGVETFVPHSSMLVALALTLLSVAMLIYFVHHIPETINVSNIAAALGRRFSSEIRAHIDERSEEKSDADDPETRRDAGNAIYPKTSGYIQNLDLKTLNSMAADNGWFVQLDAEIGQFVNSHHSVLTVYAQDELDNETIDSVRSNVAIGDRPSDVQDVTFIADQLVEMICRALSPGINDPFTAINCLNWLEAGLSDALIYEGGLQPNGYTHLSYDGLSFNHLLDASLVAARPYCEGDPLTCEHWERIVSRLKTVAAETDDGAFRRLDDLALDRSA